MESTYVSWQNNPATRGTWSIVTTCISTLIICVYSALHSNIPLIHHSKRKRFLDICKWVCIGIFAPEVLAVAAFMEWRNAGKLTKQIRDLSRTRNSRHLSAWGEWTSQHSFFVTMGGYQICELVSGEGSHAEQQPRCRHVLNGNEFMSLTQLGLITEIKPMTLDEIKDKSKAQPMTKAIAIVQAGYLLLQFVTRVSTGLAVTELEVNTLAHAFAALVSYRFWFNKPLNIENPVIIDGNRLDTWMYLSNDLGPRLEQWFKRKIEVEKQELTDALRPMLTPENSNIVWLRAPTAPLSDQDVWYSWCKATAATYPTNGKHSTRKPYRLLFLSGALPIEACGERELINGFLFRDDRFTNLIVPLPDGNDELLRSLKYPGQFLKLYSKDVKILTSFLTGLDPNVFYNSVRMLCADSDRPKKRHAKFFPKYNFNEVLVLLTPVTMIYGAIHVALWNAHFPTKTESLLWRISSVTVTCFGLAYAATIATYPLRIRMLRGSIIVCCCIPAPIQVFLATFRYEVLLECALVFARIYLVVEAFISLRSQPRSVYSNPDWTRYIPHL